MHKAKKTLIYLSCIPILGPFMIMSWLEFKSLKNECDRTRVVIFGLINGLVLICGVLFGVGIVSIIHRFVVDISTLTEVLIILLYFFTGAAFMNTFTLLVLVYKWDYFKII